MSATTERTAPSLVVTRIVDAPRALVFRAWTSPEHAARWWGPKGFTTLSCVMDVRVGGSFRLCTISPEGADYRKQGTYREIVEPERLVFTFAWEDENGLPGHQTLITVTFEEHGPKTKLTLHQAGFDTAENRDGHIIGWTSCLGRFADYMTTAEAQTA